MHRNTESSRTTCAGAAFHDRANCTGKGPPHRGPFRFQCAVEKRAAAGAESNDGSLPEVVPTSIVTTRPRLGSGVNRKGCSPSGTLSTHGRHSQEQRQYVSATDREARINRGTAVFMRTIDVHSAPSRRNWLFCRALDCSVDRVGFLAPSRANSDEYR